MNNTFWHKLHHKWGLKGEEGLNISRTLLEDWQKRSERHHQNGERGNK